MLAKLVRTGSLPGQVTKGAGHGHRVIVRGYPLGTGGDCCEWHGSGTADEDDLARSLAMAATNLTGGRARPRVRLLRRAVGRRRAKSSAEAPIQP